MLSFLSSLCLLDVLMVQLISFALLKSFLYIYINKVYFVIISTPTSVLLPPCRSQVLVWREPCNATEHLIICRSGGETAFLSGGIGSIVVPENLSLRHFGAVAVDELLEAATELPIDDTGEIAHIRTYHTAHFFHRELLVCIAAITLQTQQDTRMYAFLACAHGLQFFSFRGQRYTFFRLRQQLCINYFAIKLDFLCFWTFKVSLTVQRLF